jgi:phosphoglycerol transferase MdoB-like AlkP superfamily enzyme
LGILGSTPHAIVGDSRSSAEREVSVNRTDWAQSARFLTAWIFPAALAIYLKWYLLADQSGFARVARSQGLRSLTFYDSIGFFRGEILLGALAVPVALLLVNRLLRPKWAACLTALVAVAATLVVGVQILSLKELGRFSSLKMLAVAASWGWHEPGANAKYLASAQGLAVATALLGVLVAIFWAARSPKKPPLAPSLGVLKSLGEVYLFLVVAALLFSARSELAVTPYHRNAFACAIASLRSDGMVQTADADAFDMSRSAALAVPDLTGLTTNELIELYREFANAPAPSADPRYFGKETGANVLFFVLETTPQKYLPVGTDLKQFPNFNRLQERSFVAPHHYTTFPITHSALFSVFSSWYPIDDPAEAYDSPSWDSTGDFLRRLGASGYKTAVFSPLRSPGIPDDALFDAVGFQKQVYPNVALASYDEHASWQDQRIAADLDTLHLLESQMDGWMKHGDRFVAAFLPQIMHSPYPDHQSDGSAASLQARGEALLKQEDSWMGEILALLEKDGQLDNTIIVVFGDHGLRSISENPDLRRGTIDETAFHVPLLIHAPRALDHTEQIPWLTSHIDLAPSLLDLLGVKGERGAEQGTAIWNPALAQRTTFFFAKPMFGADGYTADGDFYMWHYFSDTIYQKPVAEFDPSDIVPRRSPVAQTVTSDITTIVAIERAWHHKFSVPGAAPAQSAKSQSPDD